MSMSQISESNLPSTEFLDGNCQWCGLKSHGRVIDLDRRFGGRWAIEWDDIGMKGSQCPWHRRISCRYGFISPTATRTGLPKPKTGTWLWACATKRRQAKLLVALSESDPEVFELKQDGDSEAAIEFHIDDIAQVFSILKPVRR